MPHLCLNSIVRNEADKIERMLNSVRKHISCFVILDTGSTDDTVEKIKWWGKVHNVPGVVAQGAFVNFSQARNQALAAARSYHEHAEAPWFDYLLLVDADMEMVTAERGDPFAGLTGEVYGIVQKAGGVSYTNVRLVSVTSKDEYVGVTHEYFGGAVTGLLTGIHFADHADGSNRKDKFARDIRLLEADLKTDPENSRSWYYLGSSYRDKGNHVEAERCFRECLASTTWDEERWSTQVNIANMLEKQGRPDAYLMEALKAYQLRPCRAEALHAIAKHYRLKGEHHIAMLFVEKGIKIPRPNDLLFIEDWVYDWGFREEYSICGYYAEGTRETAFKITNGLATDPSVPEYVRANARSNMVFYLKTVSEFCPSATMTRVPFTPRAGFTPMNPCITNRPSGDLELLVRTVNYTINEHGQYMIGETGCWDAPIETENWLLRLSDCYHNKEAVKVTWDRPAPKFDKVIGLEDMRIFWHGGERQFVACAREQSETGVPEQWHGMLSDYGSAMTVEVEGARRISNPEQCEKNWAPILDEGDLKFAYRLDTFVNAAKGDQTKWQLPVAVENISGSSQYISFRSGYLSVVHEAMVSPATGRRIYQHRFAFLDFRSNQLKLSLPFVFQDVQIEFAAGIAKNWLDGNIVISFGVRDAEAWLCSISRADIAAMLGLDR